MKDIQSEKDFRNLEIDKVGVKNIKYPITVLDKKNKTQATIANISVYVNLPHHFKGTHMSRFVEILNHYRGLITIRNYEEILTETKNKLNAKAAHLETEFPYFVEKTAPVSKAKSLMEYRCTFSGTSDETMDFVLGVKVPITTLCPCSKELSERGAHNQRGIVRVSLRFKKFIWLEDIISLIESSASSPVFSLLKRADEKFVTEKAYDNPRFVEDIVREISNKLLDDDNITWFTVEAENFESIHNHSAYAFIERNKNNRGRGNAD